GFSARSLDLDVAYSQSLIRFIHVFDRLLLSLYRRDSLHSPESPPARYHRPKDSSIIQKVFNPDNAAVCV
ncbi:hypothetical protein PMAYCL1PPCAC_32061, partial [Pristionchus mayeri]